MNSPDYAIPRPLASPAALHNEINSVYKPRRPVPCLGQRVCVGEEVKSGVLTCLRFQPGRVDR